jgi:probable F420-dependent oxidoreductase
MGDANEPAHRPQRPTLSIQLANFGQPGDDDLVGSLLMQARVADEVGVDRVVVVDHVVMGEHVEAYDGGTFPTPPDGLWPEPMTLLTAIAATTQRVRLATGILIAPLRRPATLAKTAATLDVVSGGRLELGVGVGWQREEYEANGVPFEDRGDALDRTLEVCRRLWQPGPASYDDGDGRDGLAFERIWCEPRPVQPGGVPLWISGRIHARTLRRIARYGDGWIPWGEYRREIVPGIRRAHEALAEAGRDPAGFGVRGGLRLVVGGNGEVDAEQTVAPAPELVAAGVTDFVLGAALPRDRSALVDMLAPVVEAFGALRSSALEGL